MVNPAVTAASIKDQRPVSSASQSTLFILTVRGNAHRLAVRRSRKNATNCRSF
jgi:hypothetical protein